MQLMTRLILCFFSLLLCSQAAVLSVDDVIKLVKSGLSEDVVIGQISKNGAKSDLSVDELIQLKQAGASEGVIKAMMRGASPGTSAPAAVAAPTGTNPAAAVNSGLPTEMGVYMKKSEQWVEVLPEVINWKTGGVIKSIASAGVVKGDVNGNIDGPNSRNTAKTPLEFLIVAAEGVAITEYQFIRLRVNKANREFRTVTGGVFHAKSGATRDLIPFEGKRVAPRTFSVVLPTNLGVGEYGFLPPGAIGASNSASIGKMYTFRFLE